MAERDGKKKKAVSVCGRLHSHHEVNLQRQRIGLLHYRAVLLHAIDSILWSQDYLCVIGCVIGSNSEYTSHRSQKPLALHAVVLRDINCVRTFLVISG